ncbi:pyridoxamine 5'-phosphate oxidase family protein [Roseomonas sp. PWR1]|uniref:Pyridoxamine 5'-phosphate oxidase family protein n=1 Tax=Roseomonas nitratireducens TaxID=2820810 RepID=A0ABS4AZ81_9PROT|nr:MSMEG_1061 family FMN-dependent PPOX-type flavoprotein [Neoroseomonas nitratireducens]MBP0466685.1 pyridoxamine 5'-phosphate oxidase family protein [Neoroseomonas nitratireducens]
MDTQSPADPFAVTTEARLREIYDQPLEGPIKKVTHRIEGTARAWIAASPFCILSTVGSRGVHATPRGDAPGFVAVEPDGTLLIPDRRGNNRLDALRDILEDNRVSVIFFVPGASEVLRVHGTARITADPALTGRFVERGKAPATVLAVTVTELFMQCAKSIMRSRLWDGRARPAGLPSMGQLIASHRADGAVDAADYDREAPARLEATMY